MNTSNAVHAFLKFLAGGLYSRAIIPLHNIIYDEVWTIIICVDLRSSTIMDWKFSCFLLTNYHV